MNIFKVFFLTLLISICNVTNARDIKTSISAIELAYSVKIFYQYDKIEYFPPEWTHPPIEASGKQISTNEVSILIPIINEFLSAYPKQLIEKNLKSIYLLGELTFYGKSFGATNSATGLYIKSQGVAKGFTKSFLLSQLHSEFSSILMRNYPFPKDAWNHLNPSGFRYSGTGIEVIDNENLYSTEEYLLQSGFLVVYSKSSLENDFNMISFWLFTNVSGLKEMCKNHENIKKKVMLAIGFYKNIGLNIEF